MLQATFLLRRRLSSGVRPQRFPCSGVLLVSGCSGGPPSSLAVGVFVSISLSTVAPRSSVVLYSPVASGSPVVSCSLKVSRSMVVSCQGEVPSFSFLLLLYEIFDVDHFVNAVQDYIAIVKELPSDYSWSTREYYVTGIRDTRIKTAPVHATADWYIENVLPVLKSYGIAAIAPFSHRLTFNNLPPLIQRLRCKVNFEALVFVPHIRELGATIVHRLRHNPSINEVAACDFGFGKAEKLALAKYRQSTLTQQALGFNNKTRLYLASHKVCGGKARMAALSNLRHAHNALVGHRAYLNLKTIRPNMALLDQLFQNKSMDWLGFQRAVLDGHNKNRQGLVRLRKETQSIYTYPAPDCMCRA
ncbi:hypothetical protein K1719_016178 [Acacia pycnantha]|nr:hypothetical protein K1719_016178 [Acacia pycnantha]